MRCFWRLLLFLMIGDIIDQCTDMVGIIITNNPNIGIIICNTVVIPPQGANTHHHPPTHLNPNHPSHTRNTPTPTPGGEVEEELVPSLTSTFTHPQVSQELASCPAAQQCTRLNQQVHFLNRVKSRRTKRISLLRPLLVRLLRRVSLCLLVLVVRGLVGLRAVGMLRIPTGVPPSTLLPPLARVVTHHRTHKANVYVDSVAFPVVIKMENA